MRTETVFAVVSTALLGRVVAEDAPKISGNPSGVMFEATLPDEPFFTDAAITGNVKGSISAKAPADGNGVMFSVHFENLPAEGGPFIYHLHVDPAVDGNCTSTLGHLDPYERGEKPACDASNPASCQVGDLSGKHGKVTTDPFEAEYIDPFTSLMDDSNAFFGNRSFVLHYANGTRLTCANFVEKTDPVSTSTASCDGYPASTAPATQVMTTPAGGASTATAPAGTGSMSMPTGGNANPTTVPVPGAASIAGLSISLVGGAIGMALFAM